MRKLIPLTILLTLISCGKSKTSPNFAAPSQKPPVAEPVVLPVEELDEGRYRAELMPVNPALIQGAMGEVDLIIGADELVVDVRAQGVATGVKHLQIIHTGERCPDENADVNFDGVVDFEEARSVAGEALLPLDSNLYGQVAGMNYGPIANEELLYFYRRSASLTSLMEDLTGLDHDPEDFLVKLLPGTKMRPAARVVLIYGVAEETELPEDVSSFPEARPHESVPVLCGRLERIAAPR